MFKKPIHVVRLEDGNEETIEIDGVNYIADPDNPQQPKKDEQGNPLKAEEKKPDVPPTPVDPSKLSLEELKKLNPEVARTLTEADDMRAKLQEAETKRQTEEEERMKQQGEWQKLAEQAQGKAKEAIDRATKAEKLLEKYSETVKGLYDEVLTQIPEDKRSLIPEDYSIHNKLDYVRKNANIFGVSLINKGSPIPPKENEPPVDDLGQLETELSTLMAKKDRNRIEDARMMEVASKVKEIKRAKGIIT